MLTFIYFSLIILQVLYSVVSIASAVDYLHVSVADPYPRSGYDLTHTHKDLKGQCSENCICVYNHDRWALAYSMGR